MVTHNFDLQGENIKLDDSEKTYQNKFDTITMNSRFSAKFGRFNKYSYESGLPYTGKVSNKGYSVFNELRRYFV